MFSGSSLKRLTQFHPPLSYSQATNRAQGHCHTFATLALQNGVDIKTVSGMLGHFSAGFTLDTYAHVTTAAQKEAAQTMEVILTGR